MPCSLQSRRAASTAPAGTYRWNAARRRARRAHSARASRVLTGCQNFQPPPQPATGGHARDASEVGINRIVAGPDRRVQLGARIHRPGRRPGVEEANDTVSRAARTGRSSMGDTKPPPDTDASAGARTRDYSTRVAQSRKCPSVPCRSAAFVLISWCSGPRSILSSLRPRPMNRPLTGIRRRTGPPRPRPAGCSRPAQSRRPIGVPSPFRRGRPAAQISCRAAARGTPSRSAPVDTALLVGLGSGDRRHPTIERRRSRAAAGHVELAGCPMSSPSLPETPSREIFPWWALTFLPRGKKDYRRFFDLTPRLDRGGCSRPQRGEQAVGDARLLAAIQSGPHSGRHRGPVRRGRPFMHKVR
jgi:hypothetical protein